MPKFTAEQNEQYYRVRLDPFKIRQTKGMEHRAICPLHGGSNATQLWVNVAEGNFFCFSCGKKGGSAYSFEMEFMRTLNLKGEAPNHDEVMRSLETVLGTPFTERTYPNVALAGKKAQWDRKHARDYYRYTDEIGEELFTVWRFVTREGTKYTPPDRPCPCSKNPDAECEEGCEGGRIWDLKGVRRVLYRLPEVIQSLLVIVVEGEKNANDLQRALSAYIAKHHGLQLGQLTVDHVAVTTNPGGANGWKKLHGFGRYFFGKVVIKLGDNDAAGRMHDEAVCSDLETYAKELFTLALPVDEGEDISDFLAKHPIEDFLKLLPQRKDWKLRPRREPTITDELAQRVVLVDESKLDPNSTGEPDWLVEGLIERGTRGLVVAPPKTGKSLLFLELVLCLATCRSFLGCRAYSKPVRCAVISREDPGPLVRRRLHQLAAGHGLNPYDLKFDLRFNTAKQTSRFKIDRTEDVEEMAQWLKAERIEFCVIDVLNRLHDQQENSADDMSRVMNQFDELARLAECQVCVIHHTNKSGEVRGSSAIVGWADYVVSLEQDPDDPEIKKLSIRTKQSGAIPPRTIRYMQSEDQTVSKIRMLQEVK